MRTLKTLFNNVRTRSAGRRSGVLTALLLAGVLFGAVCRAHASIDDVLVYLGSSSTGYVNVTSYLETDQYGNEWVVGYDNEPSFEIIIELSEGQVYDPFGNLIGICIGEVGPGGPFGSE